MRGIHLYAVMVVVLVVSGGVAVSYATSSASGSTQANAFVVAEGDYLQVSLRGDAVAGESGGDIYLWKDESFDYVVDFSSYQSQDEPGEEEYFVLAGYTNLDIGTDTETDSSQKNVILPFDTNDKSRGEKQMDVRFHENDPGFDNPKVEQVYFTVQIITENGDLDNDGLNNQREFSEGTDLNNPDTDRDGLDDGTEVNQYNSDPTARDSDGDGLDDGTEVDLETDPTDPNDPPEDTPNSNSMDEDSETNQNQPDQQEEQGQQAGGQQQSEPQSVTQSDNENGVQRGFFTNNQESPLAVLDPELITWIGFAISIVGILFELRRGN